LDQDEGNQRDTEQGRDKQEQALCKVGEHDYGNLTQSSGKPQRTKNGQKKRRCFEDSRNISHRHTLAILDSLYYPKSRLPKNWHHA